MFDPWLITDFEADTRILREPVRDAALQCGPVSSDPREFTPSPAIGSPNGGTHSLAVRSGSALCKGEHRWAPTISGVFDMCIDCGERRLSPRVVQSCA